MCRSLLISIIVLTSSALYPSGQVRDDFELDAERTWDAFAAKAFVWATSRKAKINLSGRRCCDGALDNRRTLFVLNCLFNVKFQKLRTAPEVHKHSNSIEFCSIQHFAGVGSRRYNEFVCPSYFSDDYYFDKRRLRPAKLHKYCIYMSHF